MKDKICLITGANAGLGKATALELARLGAVVVMLCRNAQKGEAARTEIAAASGNANVILLTADLSVMDSVRKAADTFQQRFDHLDVLINNAATNTKTRQVTADGLETMFAANYLGHFLLTNLLLDHLKASPSARVIHVTAPVNNQLDFDDLQSERQFSSLRVFGKTKMCNLLFNYALAKRLEGTRVTSNALHPGLIRTTISDIAPFPVNLLVRIISTPPEKAAQYVIYLASAPEMESVSGRFFKRKIPGEAEAYALDPENQQRLWEASLRLAHLAPISI